MANVGFYPSSHAYIFQPHHQNQQYGHFTCSRILFQHNFSSTHLSPTLSPPYRVCGSRLWDSNAESSNTHNFSDTEGGADNDNVFDDGTGQWPQVLEDYIDSIWILKVFESYGWALPFILSSMLLATGPKAFLMALALPLFQSTFTFAFQRMQGEGKSIPELKTKKIFKTKKRTSRNVIPRDEGNLRVKKEGRGYQSWVSEADGSVFGGWDELDAGMEANVRPTRRRAKSSGFRGKSAKKSKLSSRWSSNDAPLPLRLLISIFPFFEFMG